VCSTARLSEQETVILRLPEPRYGLWCLLQAHSRGGGRRDDQSAHVRLNGESSYANYETREKAEEQRNKELEMRKGESGNIYSFELVFEGKPKGEETSKPKLIYRDKDQANYESAK
jgi:hypothetical protein